MKYLDHAREGLRNLYFAKLRSFLALLGVLVGTASVVAMVLGGQLATHEALRTFQTLGTDLLALYFYNNTQETAENNASSSAATIPDLPGQIEKFWGLARAQSPDILALAPYTRLFTAITYNNHPLSGSVLGTTQQFATITHISMHQGRFISLLDRYQPYCVIGHNLYQTIKKWTYRDPIGQQLQVGKNIFTIIGVTQPWPSNSFVYMNIDDTIIIPILASTLINQKTTINDVIMRLSASTEITPIEKKITHYMNSAFPHYTIMFRSAQELITKMHQQSNILTVLLGLIGSISLVVGGIGVMNIMLVSVMERRQEIGIRLAVGAKRGDIRKLFLIEAIMLSLIGGVLGVGFGIMVAYIIAWIWHWAFTIFVWPPLIGFTVSVSVGVFFGFYPAYLASKLDPITALKTE